VKNPNPYRTIAIFWLAILMACHNGDTPKPRGYFRIDLPARAYREFNVAGYPYTFQYPVYARVVKDTLFFDKAPENPYWINIDFPGLNGKIYLTYKRIDKTNTLQKLVNQAFEMTNKHMDKADFIHTVQFDMPDSVSGLLFQVGGNAASAVQFFATDSIHHFLRGALYFYAVPNADSLAPVNQFVEQDMRHLISTLHWR
jgi:gliding motility-associated lipoprotein GldD